MILAVRRKADGTFGVLLDEETGDVLRELPQRLRSVLERPDVAEKVAARLFPKAYSDPKEEAEYRRLLGKDLLRKKLESVKVFERTLKRWEPVKLDKRKAVEVTVRPEELELWLGFVNDMRLVLGTELDIQDESWGQHFDPDHPQAQDMALLHYLSWLEEELLAAYPGEA